MKDDVKEMLAGLLYIVVHVLACFLGYSLGNYLLSEGRIGLLPLILLYVGLFFAHFFVLAGLDPVFKRFRIRLNELLEMFFSHLILITPFPFLYFWFSGWKLSALLNIGVPAFIYFTLPLGVSFFILNLIGKAMGYSFTPEKKPWSKEDNPQQLLPPPTGKLKQTSL